MGWKTPTAIHIAAWPGMAVLASLNGALRDLVYGKHLSQDTAGRVSMVPLLAMLGAYVAALARRWPLPGRPAAAQVGGAWLILTLLFEFGLGRLQGQSWRAMLREYNLFAGRTWVLVPLAMLVGPEIGRRLVSPATAARR